MQGRDVPTVDVDDISYTVSKMTGIPLFKLEETEAEKLLRMEEILHMRIIGRMIRSNPLPVRSVARERV